MFFGTKFYGGMAKKWFEQAVSYQDLKNIKLSEHVPDLPSAWERARFGILASRDEGMALDIL
ncbi:hypothetical protein SH580_16385 [Coraliomargarita algicola]|uniref:Uncharacterized protein n=1 Tax=Coraliomargarita algicola TaxID=3092156 RepID=A0ABZ0RHL7_9BACT|nr:hypothetical protein [Coraliomargarita sp. J2-16]WPJ95007.1 hypothetical protein SH580_16385 [Coraliomargarita sp. J2-16]